MLFGPSRMIVPIVSVDRPEDPPELIGTGIVISATKVITCRHVIEGWRTPDLETGASIPGKGVLCGATLHESTSVRASNRWDLCYLDFDTPLDARPAPLTRIARLDGVDLAAVGFQPDRSVPREHSIPDLKVIQMEKFEGRLQTAQFEGGIPAGFSGAPVVAKLEDAWRVVGMLWLGGEGSATSRMIALDPIANFLSEEGIEVLIADLSGSHRPASKGGRKVSIRVGRDFKGNIVEMSGDNVELDVGRDFRESVVRANGVTSEE